MRKNCIKYAVCAVLTLCFLFWAGSCVTAAAEPAEATPLSSFIWTADAKTGTVTLTQYIGTDKNVVVAGAYTLEDVTYATLLDSKTVFRNNTAIASVTLLNGVRLADHTGAYLFAGCTKLTAADLSGLNTTGVTSFRGMFSNCTKLSALTGYENWNTAALEDIYMTFDRTASLPAVDLRGWDLSHITNSGWCFQACGANRILLPDNLKTISAGFLNHAANYAGTSFTVPAGVEKIGYAHTFYDFGSKDFAEFIVAEGNTGCVAIDGILYSADGTKLLAVPRSKTFEKGVFEIPEGVTFLGELSFSRNQNITTLVLPDSLAIYHVDVSDEDYILYEDVGNLNAGSNVNIAVYCYTGITKYAVKDSNPNYTSLDGIVYSKDRTALVAVPSRYAQHMRIPEGVTAWLSDAMWSIDAAVVDGLMSKCTGVSIPASLVDIAPDQIAKLNRLNKAYDTFVITVSNDNPAYCLDEKGNLVAHSFTTQTVAPDCVNGGYTLSTCTACGGSYTTAPTEPLGHSFTDYVREGTAMIAGCDRGCGETDTVLFSSNNALQALVVEGFALTPGFHREITQYVISLPYETESITVVATAEDSKATVEIVGGNDLVAGADNEVRVICTAEDDSQRVYTVIAKRAAAPVTPTAADGMVWLVAGVAALAVACGVIWCIRKKKKR